MTQVKALRVLVCDDEEQRAQEWCDRIRESTGSVHPDALAPEEFGAAVGALKERKAKAKQGDSHHPGSVDAAEVFDDVDVLILDSDLTPDRDTAQGRNPAPSVATHLVGEIGGEVAHLARCYSNAGPIVVVNQKWRNRVFDLTMMEMAGDIAEVYISEEDIDNLGLWFPGRSEPVDFRPWHWPSLCDLPPLMSTLLTQVSLQTPIAGSLDLSQQDLEALTGRQLDALGLDDLTTETTFEEVVSHSEYGLRPKEHASPEQMLRIAVFGLRRWLDRHVLAAQNVIVDEPHLLQRQPWRVAGRDDSDVWNQQSRWWEFAGRSDQGLVPGASRWLGRPVWRWGDLSSATPDGPRVLPGDPVFCEDVSRFADVAETSDFFTDLEGPAVQRFVRQVDGVDYNPKRRLLT